MISLTKEELKKLEVINKANAGFTTVKEASEKLGISERQVQRLKKAVKEKGAAELVHKNTGRKPAHALTDAKQATIMQIRNMAGYSASNFKHFQELLDVNHDIQISYSALSRLMAKNSIESPKKRRRYKVHRRRKRREQMGSLIQVDGSLYDWLGTGKLYTLHGGIDDATGQIVGLYLCKNECMNGYHEMMRRMIEVYGIPEAVYADKHTIFRSPNVDKAKAADAPKDMQINETQFGRAMSELSIKIIAARSPQAKGRIERLWGTLQSRLPVELAIRSITEPDAANQFLKTYIFSLNSEFALEPKDYDNAFLPLEEGVNLDHILCIKETRALDNGHVFSYKGKLFRINDAPFTDYIPPKAKVTIMISPRIGVKAAYLRYVFDTSPATQKQPKVAESAPLKTLDHVRIYKPESAWEPKDGMPWQPGQPTYHEVLEMISDIFDKPYPKTTTKNGIAL